MSVDPMIISRAEAIDDLREMLLTLADEKTSACEAIACTRVGCRGLSRFTLNELKDRFPWIAREHPDADRHGFEQHAHRWILSLQLVTCGRLPCDTLAGSTLRTPCAGWGEYDDEELAHLYRALLGVRVSVVGSRHARTRHP